MKTLIALILSSIIFYGCGVDTDSPDVLSDPYKMGEIYTKATSLGEMTIARDNEQFSLLAYYQLGRIVFTEKDSQLHIFINVYDSGESSVYYAKANFINVDSFTVVDEDIITNAYISNGMIVLDGAYTLEEYLDL